MILKFFIAVIGAYSLYGSYSTYISRKIRKEMIARNHQAKVDMHNNREGEAAADTEIAVMDVPTVFEIERKFNERVSSQAIYDMHDRLDLLESRKLKMGELEHKIGSIELAQNELFDVPRSNESVKRQNALLKERVEVLEAQILKLNNKIENNNAN